MADVPVNDQVPSIVVDVVTNGQTVFDYSFRADDVGDLRAQYRPALGSVVDLVGGVDFVASGLGTATGGTITLVTFTATVAGADLAIYRQIPIERSNDYTRDLFAADLNSEQDEIYMIMQQLQRDIARSMKVGIGETPPDISEVLLASDLAIEAAQAAIGAANGQFIFLSKASAAEANIPAVVHAILTYGEATQSDGLGGVFIDTNNGNSETFISADGRTWYRVADVNRRRIRDKITFKPQDYLATAGTSFAVDATAAINAAIAAANAAGGIAYVPKGSYGISGTGLLILEGSRIDLHSSAVLRRLTAGEIWRNWIAGGAYAGRTAAGNWKIRGGVFDVRGSVLGAGLTYSIANICQAKNILFEGCVFQDVYGGHCVDLAGCMDAHLVRCVFKDFTMQAGREFSEAIQIDIVSNTGFPDGMDPSTYNGATCQGVFVEECVFENYPTAVGSHGYGTDGFTDYYHELIFIKDCICRSMSYESFRPQRWRLFDINGVAASGNSGRAFIRIDSCTEFAVANFKWNGPTSAPPIQITKSAVAVYDAKNWSLGPGSVTGSGNHGALLFSMNGGTVRGLNIDGAGSASNGLVLDGCTEMLIDDVEIHDVGAANAGIRLLNTCQRVRVNNPRISGVYSVGVLVEGNSSDCVIDGATVRDMAAGRIGVRLAGSNRSILRDGKIIGSGGTGVDVTAGATAAWVDGMDLRGLGGASKIVVTGTTIVNSNNQV